MVDDLRWVLSDINSNQGAMIEGAFKLIRWGSLGLDDLGFDIQRLLFHLIRRFESLSWWYNVFTYFSFAISFLPHMEVLDGAVLSVRSHSWYN